MNLFNLELTTQDMNYTCQIYNITQIKCITTDYDTFLEKFSGVLSVLLLISEILPFIKNIKSNGIVQAVHMNIFYRDEPLTNVSKSRENYGSIHEI